MSSSSELIRSRVLRGAITTRLRSVPFTEDLAGDRPMMGLDPAIVERAVADGRQAGYEQGYARGLAAAATSAAEGESRRAAEFATAIRALTNAAATLREQHVDAATGIEQELTEAALAIAEAVIGRELAVADDPGADALARALGLAPEGEAVAHLNPADVATLGQIDCGRDVTIVADPSVEPGGCLLEVGACRIDAQLSTALARVREAMGQ